MDWAGIGTAYLDRERQRLGLPSRRELEEKRAMEARRAAESASQLESEGVTRDFNRARIAAMPGEQALDTRLKEAQISNYAEIAQPRAEPSSELERVMAMAPEQQAEWLRLKKASAPASQGSTMLMPYVASDPTTGNPVVFDKRTGKPIPGMAPAPTAEMRNTEYQSGAVEPAFDLMEQSLGNLETATGGMSGAAKALIPGTDAYYAKSRFVDQAKALAGAIVARQAGEGSRLSDEDRVAYSRAATLVNNSILLPGGIEEARARLGEARQLITTVMARRKQVGMGQSAGTAVPPQTGATTTVRSKSDYDALQPGTIYMTPDGKRRRKP